jgi:hypothetical protein
MIENLTKNNNNSLNQKIFYLSIFPILMIITGAIQLFCGFELKTYGIQTKGYYIETYGSIDQEYRGRVNYYDRYFFYDKKGIKYTIETKEHKPLEQEIYIKYLPLNPEINDKDITYGYLGGPLVAIYHIFLNKFSF